MSARSHDSHRFHDSHGQHPLGVLAFFLLIVGFASLAVLLVSVVVGNTALAVTAAIVGLVAFGVAATTMTMLGRKLHHSALIPDYTDTETEHYLRDYRHGV
ncbi:hypothetical protein [Gordonia sp. N1V]|uniref:hypothetical protein n=1 Tax=Gordonia sp. N1V TaxID=3034163 RepID=UPI0023E2FB30|nr:hypothetical protein [Gordonia sp. N1V]MDF3283727.1 hypothetical protein [Gordonia sp. N1V]